MKRQPMVVSKISAWRLKAVSALPITKGARLMLSTPPAIMKWASPDLMARAAEPKASKPEPHKRLTVLALTSGGKPESNKAIRPTLRLSSPAWLTLPYTTSVRACQSTWGLRAMSAAKGTAPKSSARTLESTPP